MDEYRKFKERQQAEVNALPLKFAFSDKQFKESMEELGLKETDTDKVYSMNGCGFYLKTDSDLIFSTFTRLEQEIQAAMQADTTGTGFMLEMFRYELANHEYGYTRDITQTLDALQITEEELNANPTMRKALDAAIQEYKRA